MSNIRLVLFDMDGLMFDTERLSLECWIKAGETLGVPAPAEAIRNTVGRNIHDTRQIVLDAMADFPFEEARKLRDQYVLEYAAEHGTPAMPGLGQLLDYLEAAGILRAVATSTEEARGKGLLTYGGVLERFDTVVYGNMVSRGKPHPDIFLKAAELLEVPPAQCLVLEDSPAGVEAAYRAGMPVIMICDMVQPDEATKGRYTAQLDSLDQVIGFLTAPNQP